MSNTAEQLAQVQAELDHHWFALQLHQDAIRVLQLDEKMLQQALKREQEREDRQARRFMGPSARRSA